MADVGPEVVEWEPEDTDTYRYEYRVFPGLGIARMGNSKTQCFVGPEVPTHNFVPERLDITTLEPIGATIIDREGFREKTGRRDIAKQAARFRLFQFKFLKVKDSCVPVELRELTSATHHIKWTVKVANHKSFSAHAIEVYQANPSLAHESGEVEVVKGKGDVSVSSRTMLSATNGAVGITIQNLGSVIAEKDGQLLVLGSDGDAQTTTGLFQGSGLGSIYESLFNKNCYDDAADGYVKASFKLNEGDDWQDADENSWVVVGPPDFGNDIEPIVSLFDYGMSLVLNNSKVAQNAQLTSGNWRSLYLTTTTSFMKDVLPIFRRTLDQSTVYTKTHLSVADQVKATHATPYATALANSSHSSFQPGVGQAAEKEARATVFNRLRIPPCTQTPYNIREHETSTGTYTNIEDLYENWYYDTDMPKLIGTDEMALIANKGAMTITPYQYNHVFKNWLEGQVTDPWNGLQPSSDATGNLSSIANADDHPGMMDRAHMGRMCGGSFLPGIEVGVEVMNITTWRVIDGFANADTDDFVYLRINSPHCYKEETTGTIQPGHLTRSLAVPWQGDFYSCNTNYWPASRPGVLPNTNIDWADHASWSNNKKLSMLTSWHKLGFICRKKATDTTQNMGLEQRYSY